MEKIYVRDLRAESTGPVLNRTSDSKSLGLQWLGGWGNESSILVFMGRSRFGGNNNEFNIGKLVLKYLRNFQGTSSCTHVLESREEEM